MIDLYSSGTSAKQVAEGFGVSIRSVMQLLRQHGVRVKVAQHRGNPRSLATIASPTPAHTDS
jgi:transposase